VSPTREARVLALGDASNEFSVFLNCDTSFMSGDVVKARAVHAGDYDLCETRAPDRA